MSLQRLHRVRPDTVHAPAHEAELVAVGRGQSLAGIAADRPTGKCYYSGTGLIKHGEDAAAGLRWRRNSKGSVVVDVLDRAEAEVDRDIAGGITIRGRVDAAAQVLPGG